MGKALKISEARKRLFELVEEVTGEDHEVVWIEHRDNPKRAALVSEDYLRYLHATITALRKENAAEFRLAGSMAVAWSEDELEAALTRSAAEQAILAERKFRDL